MNRAMPGCFNPTDLSNAVASGGKSSGNGARPAGTCLILAALALVLVATSPAVVTARAGGKPVTIPPPELVGRWQGQGRVVDNWTSVQSVPMNLAILPDGTVAGQIGLASIAGGSFAEYSKKKKPPYVLTLNLDGPLLEDGLMRRSFQFSLRPEGARLAGSGTSDGWKSFPGVSREHGRHSMRLRVTAVSLAKANTFVP